MTVPRAIVKGGLSAMDWEVEPDRDCAVGVDFYRLIVYKSKALFIKADAK